MKHVHAPDAAAAPVLLLMTSLPDAESAAAMAATLVSERLAACVTRLPASESVYRWQGSIESASEVPLLIKTTAQAYPALAARVQALHPYDVPELIAVPVVAGLPAYLDWVVAETAAC